MSSRIQILVAAFKILGKASLYLQKDTWPIGFRLGHVQIEVTFRATREPTEASDQLAFILDQLSTKLASNVWQELPTQDRRQEYELKENSLPGTGDSSTAWGKSNCETIDCPCKHSR